MRLLLIIALLFSTATAQNTFFGVLAGGGSKIDGNASVYLDSVDNYVTVTDINRRRIDTLFKKLKGRLTGYSVNYWDSIVAFYPIFGANANTHNLNGKLPSQYRISWSGTITHNVSGAQGNGTTGYGDVNGITQSVLGANSFGFGVYAVSGGGSGNCEVGYAQTTPSNSSSYIYFFSGLGQYAANTNLTDTSLPQTPTGIHFTNRTNSSNYTAWRNSTKLATVQKASVTAGSLNFFVMARNLNGSPQAYSNTIHGFYIFTTGLSDTGVQNISTIISEYNASLSR